MYKRQPSQDTEPELEIFRIPCVSVVPVRIAAFNVFFVSVFSVFAPMRTSESFPAIARVGASAKLEVPVELKKPLHNAVPINVAYSKVTFLSIFSAS